MNKTIIYVLILAAFVAGSFYFAHKSGYSACLSDMAQKQAQIERNDIASREKADHAIRKASDTDLDRRLDRWMRD